MNAETAAEKRFNELYRRAYEKNYPCFTDFLNLDEQSTLARLHLPCVKFGGYENAERVIAAFGEAEEDDFPITILKIAPQNKKFADALTHRDFLGGLMSLGIKRELIGDIIADGSTAYVFCINHIADYICDSLVKIRRTSVTVCKADVLPDGIIKPPQECEITVTSLRADAVISAAYRLSRRESAELFEHEKVFVNSRAVTSGAYKIKDGDIISVRGHGRIKYAETLRSTKKDRLVIRAEIY